MHGARALDHWSAVADVFGVLDRYAATLARPRRNPVLVARLTELQTQLTTLHLLSRIEGTYARFHTSSQGDSRTVATYAYRCRACGEEFEVKRPMHERAELDAQPPVCPQCGKNDVQKIVSMFTSIKDWRTT
jgi:putative FmdB family regulatory protein